MRLMRKLGLLGVLLIGLLAASHIASPVRAHASEEENVVRGHADFAKFAMHVSVHAESDADGDDAEGVVRFTQGGLSFVGKVTCLSIVGNRALLSGPIVTSNFPALVGIGFIQLIAAPDQSLTALTNKPPTVCSKPGLFTGFKATSGHFRVRAAEDEDEDD